MVVKKQEPSLQSEKTLRSYDFTASRRMPGVCEPRYITQRLNDSKASGAINRAPTPESVVRLPSIVSIRSLRGKLLYPAACAKV